MSRARFIAALGISTALALCGAASAADLGADAQASVVVRTDDVNLSTPAGARLMALRIRNAATAVCGANLNPVAFRLSEGFSHCREAAIDRAVHQLRTPFVAEALGHPPQRLTRGD